MISTGWPGFHRARPSASNHEGRAEVTTVIIQWPLLVFTGAFCALWLTYLYLLLFRPTTFIEWFAARTWRPWGVTITVTDPPRLIRKGRQVGLIVLSIGLFVLGMLLRDVFTGGR